MGMEHLQQRERHQQLAVPPLLVAVKYPPKQNRPQR